MPFASAVSQVTPFKPAFSTLPMPDLAEFMTTKEAAQVLGFTIPGVHGLIKKSKLESVHVGRIYLISRKSVKSYLEKTQGMGKNDPTRGKEAQEN
jgi:excisionase family DNA binding protein